MENTEEMLKVLRIHLENPDGGKKTEVQAIPQDNIQCFLGAERLLNSYTDCTSISNIKI